MDAAEQRAAQRERWGRSAPAWGARAAEVQRTAMPVSRWLIDALRLQPGHRVLELAAGPGETGFLAAELVAPGGTVVSSDLAEEMLEAGRARAAQLGLDNVEFKPIDLEWIDEPTASVDAVICRWGYMFAVDTAAALRETRRVLRPGGRAGLAVWDEPRHNPWATAGAAELEARGLVPPPAPDAPGMFSLAGAARLEELLGEAGFLEVSVEPLDLVQHHASFDAYWSLQRDLSLALGDAVAALDDDAATDLARAVAARLDPFTAADGSLAIPGRALVAAASA
jgi:SAM-dependent methyltransferase